MVRLLGEGFGLFLLPFALYVVFLIARHRVPALREFAASERLVPLAAMGLAFAILGLLGMGLLGTRYRGGYQPAHIENGRLVPSRME